MSTIQEALVITVNGILIVFFILFILMLVLMAMKWFAPKENRVGGQKSEKGLEPQQEAPQAAAASADVGVDDELVVVLTAAVAASLNTSTYRLRIASYRRMEDKVPAWNAASRRENIQNKLN